MLQERFTGTDLQVGFTIDHSLNTYVPKPMILYMYDETVATFKFYNGSTYDTITEYMPFRSRLNRRNRQLYVKLQCRNKHVIKSSGYEYFIFCLLRTILT